jgi:hypothetical protein
LRSEGFGVIKISLEIREQEMLLLMIREQVVSPSNLKGCA